MAENNQLLPSRGVNITTAGHEDLRDTSPRWHHTTTNISHGASSATSTIISTPL